MLSPQYSSCCYLPAEKLDVEVEDQDHSAEEGICRSPVRKSTFPSIVVVSLLGSVIIGLFVFCSSRCLSSKHKRLIQNARLLRLRSGQGVGDDLSCYVERSIQFGRRHQC